MKERDNHGLGPGTIAWMAAIFGATIGILDVLDYIQLMH